MTVEQRPWARVRDLAVVESPSRAAILDLRALANPPIILEGTAAAIWWLVDGTRRTEEIVTEVASAYDITAAEVAEQVAAFLEELADQHLVECSTESDDPGAADGATR